MLARSTRCLVASSSLLAQIPLRCLSDAPARDEFRLREFSEKYLGRRKAAFTEKLEFINPHELPTIPIYRVTSVHGEVIDPQQELDLDKVPNDSRICMFQEKLIRMYKAMTQLAVQDQILYDSQRQGRIVFQMTNSGEEGTQVGSAAGLEERDWIFGQYREVGVLAWRGFPLQRFMDHAHSNKNDVCGHGKSMPMHYGSRDLNFVNISSPLSNQLPQAVGVAYSFKREKNNNRIVAVYFGDGASSEGDTHAGFNFAATLSCPVIFICRNNGYAISTPVRQQYAGDGIAGRGPGYGLQTIRVDGNDVLAVYKATRAARLLALQNKPVLIEALSYRLGHHSTSDDSTVYRPAEEVKFWTGLHPIDRFKKFLILQGHWSDEADKEWLSEIKHRVLEALEEAERTKKEHVHEMFETVYAGEKPLPHILRQRDELNAHLAEYGQYYELADFEKKHYKQ